MDKRSVFVYALAIVVVLAASFFLAQESLAPKSGQNQKQNNSGAAAAVKKCALETCHGLDIKCGANPPAVCTDIYQMGDRCLQYAKCDQIAGVCRQMADSRFDACKSCVQNCNTGFRNNQVGLFNCESKCGANDTAPEAVDGPAARKKAVDLAFPAFYDFENQKSFAGRSIKTDVSGSDYYFAYIEYGSGVPIAKATCFKVNSSLEVTEVGEFPNSITGVGVYIGIDPRTCSGISGGKE